MSTGPCGPESTVKIPEKEIPAAEEKYGLYLCHTKWHLQQQLVPPLTASMIINVTLLQEENNEALIRHLLTKEFLCSDNVTLTCDNS
jgi:hypothetical protein